MIKPQFFSVLIVTLAALAVSCHRDDVAKPSAEVKRSVQEQSDMNDPEIAKLNEKIKKHPNRAELFWKRASAFYARDKFDLAFRDYGEAIRLDPTNSTFFDDRGFAYHMNDRQEEKALADYDEAVRLEADNHHALNNRAYLLATTLDDGVRNGKKALEDASKACELTRWKIPGYLDTLAVAYAEVGDFEKAIKWQKKALEDADFAQEWGQNGRLQLKLFSEKKPYRE